MVDVNVASLQEGGRLKIPETLSFQCGPVVIGDRMYVTTVKSTYAADARTGQQKWVRTIEPETQMIGTPVRGVAYADGRPTGSRRGAGRCSAASST
jgi:glucose dehydrogenase